MQFARPVQAGLLALDKMREKRSFRFVLAAGLALICLAGCKSIPAPAVAAPAENPGARFAGLSDEALVRANQNDGVGLGLRAAGSSFQAGQAIPLRILVEDLGARVPIAGGLCEGASLRYDDAVDQQGSTSKLNNSHCIEMVPNPDEVPLVPGHLKVFEVTQENASHMTIRPGTYDLTVTWAVPPAGKGRILASEPYTTITSNPVRVTVRP